ncbi:MAG: hypothetical protein GEU88_06320 [Solirubrobacterales bacterium]|nr:hypothetical protein [Solirubrobacterales bacterium]
MAARLIGLVAVIWCLASAPAGAAVLYVGDSLGVGTAPPLRDQLGGVRLDVDAKVSRSSGVGLDVLRSRIGPQHEIVIFDLGTNDDPASPASLAADLAAAREATAGRCLIVATLNRPPLNGVSINGLNRVVVEFAARTPGVQVVDWHAAAAQPDLFVDGVHVGPDAYALRAKLFADAIAACASSGSAAPGSPAAPSAPAAADEPLRPPQAVAGRPAQPDPALRPRPRKRDPLRAPAVQVARAVGVGADFG